MGVTEPIRIGMLHLTPKSFNGKHVAIELEADGEPLGDGSATISIVKDQRDENTVPGPEGPLHAIPMLPIPVWESLQAAAAQLERK